MMNTNLQSKETTQLKPVAVDAHEAIINDIARQLRGHAANLRYTFRDENTYKSLTDYFVISMVMQSIPLIGKNMDLVKLHVNSILVTKR